MKIMVNVVGTAGVPACYGGFETMVEHLIEFPQSNIEYTIFCSKKMYAREKRLTNYKGANLLYLSPSANGISSVYYDLLCMLKSLNSDIMLILGVSGCIFLPIIRAIYKGKIITNIDGLEWKRQKWNKLAKALLHFSEKMAVKYSDIIIGDNKGITDYVTQEYNKSAYLIEYGADHAKVALNNSYLNDFTFCKHPYAITVCRIEPENNIHLILEAFSKLSDMQLVVVGNWNKSEYGINLRNKFFVYKNICLIDPIYDQDKINWLRSSAIMYIHGHSAGGTNPSLIEAMNLGLPIIAFDCVYNRETTENECLYWRDVNSLIELLKSMSVDSRKKIGENMRVIANKRYTWKIITEKYVQLFEKR